MKSHTIRYRICTCDVDIRKSYKAFSFMTQAQEIANYHASRIGFGYADLIKDNIVWVLSRMKVSYLSSPKWEDEVELTTWHKGREGVFSLRDFEITPAGGGSPLIQATSSWLLIDAGTRRMLRPDPVLGEKSTSTALDRNALAEPCGKLLTPAEGMEQVRTHEVLYSDMDFNLPTTPSTSSGPSTPSPPKSCPVAEALTHTRSTSTTRPAWATASTFSGQPPHPESSS